MCFLAWSIDFPLQLQGKLLVTCSNTSLKAKELNGHTAGGLGPGTPWNDKKKGLSVLLNKPLSLAVWGDSDFKLP